jgi:hypothetical protein
MSDNVKMNQKFELWRSKKQKVVSAVINKNQPVYTAIKALNSKELPSVLQNKNIRTSTPWRDLLRMSLAFENTKMKVDTNDEDDSILLVENNEEANYLVHCALVKTAFFVGDDLNIDYKDAYSRIINYIKDNDLHSDIHNLIKKLRVIVPDNLIT